MTRRRTFRFPRRGAVQVAVDVDEELAFHLERVAAELVDDGWLPEAARVEAQRRFGDLEGTRAYCRAIDASKERQMKWIERFAELGQDLRFAGRQLWKSPVFTLVAVLTLALGIGSTTAIFSVVYGVVLRPLPFAAPERLVRAYFVSPTGEKQGAFSAPNFIDWRAASHALADATPVHGGTLNLSGDGAEPARLQAAWVGANYFKVVGIRPLAGRTFAPGEDHPGAPRVAVLAEKLWRQRFGADPGLIGRAIALNGQPHTVVGILKSGEQLPGAAEVWVPLVFSVEDLGQRSGVFFSTLGRLAPGATLAQAQAETDTIGKRLVQQYPEDNAGYFTTMTLAPLQEAMVGDVRKKLLFLLGAVGLVLLIAASNVANLLLVRAAAREGEIVIRAALGAGRARIVRQLLTESLVLALAGGAAGVALAASVTRALIALSPQGIPRLDQVGLDGTVLLFALGISLLTGVLFGLAPALQTSRTDLSGVIREGARGSKGRAATRARSVLVVVEMALAVVLLAGAGLLIRSFQRLQEVDPGFKPAGVVTFNLTLPAARYPDGARQRTFLGGLLERLRSLPGVDAAAATAYGLPLSGQDNVTTLHVIGRPPVPVGKEEAIRLAATTPDYFKALGIRLLRGRAFSPRDRDGAPRVVLLNEAAASHYFPNEDPLGHRIELSLKIAGVSEGGEIVGIVADVKQDAMEQTVEPQLFVPFDQLPMDSLGIVLRSTADSSAVAAAVQAKVRELDPTFPSTVCNR
jgi:putative ABC transport system permease protein